MPGKKEIIEGENLGQFDTLVAIMAELRGPCGCPWDRSQSHQSVRQNLLEETYEVLEALDSHDSARLKEELGDLLLQVVLHSQIAKDNDDFDINQVIRLINEKLIRRHPHIFGSRKASSVEQVAANWEEIKKHERPKENCMLDGIPSSLPSLAYSQEIQKRVARVGFDWDTDEGVINKVVEEVSEIDTAVTHSEKEAEYGDLLFTLANLARRQGVDLESALRGANLKFYKRFSTMEKLCRKRSLDFSTLTFDKQNALWDEVKKTVE